MTHEELVADAVAVLESSPRTEDTVPLICLGESLLSEIRRLYAERGARKVADEPEIRIAAYSVMATKLPEFVRDPETGEILRDANGEPRRIRGAVVRLTSPD